MSANIDEVRKAAEKLADDPLWRGRYRIDAEGNDRCDDQRFEIRAIVCDAQLVSRYLLAELARRDREAAERERPLYMTKLGVVAECDTWRVEHVIAGVGKTAILLTDRGDGEQVLLTCIKTQGQLDDLLAALKGGKS